MSTRQSAVVHIARPEDIDDLRSRLPALTGEHVFVTVEESGDTLLTAAEFHSMASAAREADVTLALSTSDPLRRQLARMLGWSVVPGTGFEKPASAEPGAATTADLATYQPEIFQEPAETSERRTLDAAPERTALTPPASQPVQAAAPRSEAPTAARERGGAAHPAAATRRTPPTVFAHPASGAAGRTHRRRKRWPLVLGTFLLLTVFAAAGSAAAVYYLPEATIQLVPAERALSADLVYGVARPSTSYDITLQPSPLNHRVTFTRSIPPTGERWVPDGTAAGTLTLLNAATASQAVPGGTPIKGANGVSYVTQASVTIAAADPFGTGALGSGTVKVAAATPGSGGNAPPGSLTGQLSANVYYKNPNAISGGSERRIAVVSQADVDALTKAAKDDLNARAEPEFRRAVPGGSQLLPDSIQIDGPSVTLNHAAGDDAEELRAEGSASVSGQVFDPSSLHLQARDEVGKRLAAQVGSDSLLLGDTLAISDPKPLADGTSWAVHAEGRVRYVVSDGTRNDVAQRLAGKSQVEAEQILRDVPGVESFRLNLQPHWLASRLSRMPWEARKIKVTTSGRNTARGTA